MNNEEALFQAILDTPDDDAPRLVYADWLEENGQPERAEFIRAQVELGRPKKRGALERRRELAARVQVLEQAHGSRWRKSLPRLNGIRWGNWERGFVAWATATDCAAFRKHRQRLFQAAPIQGLHIVSLEPADVPELAEMPELASLRALNLYRAVGEGEGVGDEEARLLANSPYLTKLRDLDLIQNRLGTEGLRALAHSPRLRALESLQLYGNVLDDDSVRMLVASPLARRLRGLWLGGSFEMTAATARALADTPWPAHVTALDLNNTHTADAGARALAECAHFKHLTYLNLHLAEIGTAGVKALAASPYLAALRFLDLSNNPFADSGARALVRSPYLRKIRRLDLWDQDDFSEAAERALRERFGKAVIVPYEDDASDPEWEDP